MSRWGKVEITPASILFEDDDLVAVDKASGVLCDASRDPDREHLGTGLVRWATQRQQNDEFHPAHRLDLGTSGVVLFARNRSSATAMMQQFQDRTVAKQYQAVVNLPATAEWAVGTLFNRRSFLRHRKGVSEEVRSGGKTAVTAFEVEAIDGRRALVQASPRTGRTHQLRVHLAALGAPIVGDDRYGTSDSSRLWLHAHTLTFTHPGTGEPLTVQSRSRLGLDKGEATEVT